LNTPEQEVRLAFGRMAGLLLAVVVLTLGVAIAFIVGAAVILRFFYGG
jgi:hypothetical protein